MSDNFDADLELGEKIEDLIFDRLVQTVPGIMFHKNCQKDYDCEVRARFEVKYDKMSDKTGNVAFEISYKGTPSGVMASKSHYIIYLLNKDKRWYWQRTLLARDWLKNNEQHFRIIHGGDNKDSALMLIPYDTFIHFFKRLT